MILYTCEVREAIIDQVEILIITAIPEELEILKLHFNLNEVSSNTSANHYYIHDRTISSNTLAIMCLHEMGNVHAAAATMSAINDLSPSYVFMFGLGGSLKEDEVKIGDVAVSSDVFYCEMGKEKHDWNASQKKHSGDFLEVRSRAFPVDIPLLRQIQHYISFEMDDVPYTVHTGIFAITEKVIANHTSRDRLHNIQPKFIVVEMESYGVSYASAFFKRYIRFIAIRAISDYADPDKGDSDRKSALENAAHFLIGFLKKHKLPVNTLPQLEIQESSLIAIHHLSLNFQEHVTPTMALFDGELAGTQIIPVVIDQTGWFVKGSLTHPEVALERQIENVNRITQLQKEMPHASIGYFGLAHVPLVFHLGHILFRRKITTFGNYHDTGEWFRLAEVGDTPNISIDLQVNNRPNPSNDVIVRMSVSYPVLSEQLEQIPENPLAYCHIYHDAPIPDKAISYSQPAVDAFVSAFNTASERIMREFPQVERVHLFFAGAPTIAFRCGQLINPNTDPQWIVYNFSRQDLPNYGWAIHLQEARVVERRK